MDAIVRDIQKFQKTPEKEVYQEENFLGKALDTLGTLARKAASSSGEKKNYANLEKRTEQFFDEMQAKGLKSDDAEFIDKYKSFRTDAFSMSENYTPSEVDAFFKDYFGEEFKKPTKALIEADVQKEMDMNEEAILIGAQKFPGLKPSQQAAEGRRFMLSKVNAEAIEKLLPSMSKEEREKILEGSYRDAFLDMINLDFQKVLDNNGGIVTTQIVNAYKDDMTARLKMAGFPAAAAQKFVDNAMGLYAGLAEKHAGDTEKLAKDTENIKQVFTNQLQMAAYATPVTYTDKAGNTVSTNMGAMAASLGVTKLADLPPEFLANNLSILNQVAQDPNLIDMAKLPNDLKGIVMSRQGLFRIARNFEDNSPGKKALEKISNEQAKEYLDNLKTMTREDLSKATNYNTAANAYVTSHEIVTPEETTPEDQKQEFEVFADAAGEAYNTFLQDNGFVLVDNAGNPHYITYNVFTDSFQDSTNDGQTIEFLDNDAVDARAKVFGAVRQMISTASKYMPTKEAIDIWNTSQIKTSGKARAVNLFGTAEEKLGSIGAIAATNPLVRERVESVTGAPERTSLIATMTPEKIKYIKDNFNNGNFEVQRGAPKESDVQPGHTYRIPVTNARYSTYDTKNGTVVFTANMGATVKSPIKGVLTNARGNIFTDVNSVELKEDVTGNIWTISGTKMENGYVKAGGRVREGDKIGVLRGFKPAIGIGIRDAKGDIIDPRTFFAAPVPPAKPSSVARATPLPTPKPADIA